MPITKTANVIVATAPAKGKQSAETSVFADNDFAICDKTDPVKQVQFDCSAITSGTPVVHKITSVGFYTYYDCTASAGGSATESLTFTGLGATDKVIALFILTKGANAVSIVGTDTQSANTLSVTFSGDPGAGAVLRALVAKA